MDEREEADDHCKSKSDASNHLSFPDFLFKNLNSFFNVHIRPFFNDNHENPRDKRLTGIQL